MIGMIGTPQGKPTVATIVAMNVAKKVFPSPSSCIFVRKPMREETLAGFVSLGQSHPPPSESPGGFVKKIQQFLPVELPKFAG